MNNQFATQFLLEDTSELESTVIGTLQDAGVTDEHLIKIMTDAVMNGVITLEKAIQIVQNPHIDEMTGSGAVGGSTVGGGTTDGASWDPQGPTGNGEQYAAGTRKKKYQEGTFDSKEHIAIFSGPDGTANVYKLPDGTFYAQVEGDPDYDMTAGDAKEMAVKLKRDGLTQKISGEIEEDAPRLAGDPGKTNKQGSKNLNAYKSVGFTAAPSAQEAGKKLKSIDVKDLWEDEEELNESRAYSRFKKQAATRTKDQQMHEAVKMIHNKLEEVSRLAEFAQQMRNELSEGETNLEYKHSTKKVFEKINKKVIEVYSKTKKLG